MNLFKKVAAFSDLHLGLKGNSQIHLQDCEEFVDWFIDEAKKNDCETCIFLGDYHHNRNSINLVTLDASIRCLEKLGAAFEQFFWFPGNHDLFYKDKRSIHSSVYGKHIPGMTIIDNITTIHDVTLVPWMIGNEWKTLKHVQSKYIFGHLELPLFFMNAMIAMPDQGELKADDLKKSEYIFSGHFHKRQSRDNIVYIGNAFPHNYADTWDDERGMMILEWGGTPQFINWPNMPRYRTIKLSELIDKKDEIMMTKMHLRVSLDIDISFEEANFIKETFMSEYDVREMSLIQDKVNLDGTIDDLPDQKFESVDQIVVDQIIKIESDQFDKNILLEIYNSI